MAALDALLENNNSNGLNSTNGSSSTNGEHSIIPAKAPPFSKRVEGQGQGQDQGQGQGQGDDGYGDAESSLRRGGNGVGMSRQSSGALPRAEEKVLRGGGGRATGGGGGGDGGAHWEEHPSLRRGAGEWVTVAGRVGEESPPLQDSGRHRPQGRRARRLVRPIKPVAVALTVMVTLRATVTEAWTSPMVEGASEGGQRGR